MDLFNKFESFHFSKIETRVYLTLLEHPELNGSQLAKFLNISRSSTYAALESLYSRGAVYLLQGETNSYSAENPEILFDKLASNYAKDAIEIKAELKKIKKADSNDNYWNIKGYENITGKIKSIIVESRDELYINTNFQLDDYLNELKDAIGRGVRVVLFSFTKINLHGLKIDYFYNEVLDIKKGSCKKKILLVADYQTTLIAQGEMNEDFTGTFSTNPLLTSIVSEHIHHDIYLLKLRNKSKKEIFDDNIFINTKQEKLHLEKIRELQAGEKEK